MVAQIGWKKIGNELDLSLPPIKLMFKNIEITP